MQKIIRVFKQKIANIFVIAAWIDPRDPAAVQDSVIGIEVLKRKIIR
jgi:hypothetical protein